jgi:sec-independent protein translocase protein TatA
MPGGPEWIVVAIVAVVVLFGAKKIPEMARSLGRAQGEFKKGMKEGATESDVAGTSDDTSTRAENKAETSD